ncbi:DUF4123 domain-containing protein [Luteimonas sp. A537]
MTVHYALVDSAQRPHFHERLENLRTPYRSLFDGTAEQALKDIAPLLVEHIGELTDNSSLNRELRSLGERKPAVSLIASDASMDELATHFRSFHLVRVPEHGEKDMLVRWYDTRILPIWMQLLRPDQQSSFIGTICEWRYYDRFGDMKELILPARPAEGFPALPPLRLDADQYNNFLDACTPDAAIAQLRRIIPEEIRQVPYRTLYPFISAHLCDSFAHGLAMLDDHAQYLLLALYTSGGFREHPSVIERLAENALALPDSFTDWATALPEDVWLTGIPLWQYGTEQFAGLRSVSR